MRRNGTLRRARSAGVRATALALLLASTTITPAAATDDGTVVTISDGTLRGQADSGGRHFSDIPYAAPPTGDLRFRPPQAVAPWTGVRDATLPQPACPQTLASDTDEDCLVLDVRTPPEPESRNLPVMVWIHGGAYTSASASAFDLSPVVTMGKVIVVSINYRLGALGFLGLPELISESGTTGNYGILDQQAALKWVRRNIAAFGGNPRNITLFGQSAGGHSVCTQLISPSASGLFDKAISQSGGCIGTNLGPTPAATAYTRSSAFADKAGCRDSATRLACLRSMTTTDLVNAQGSSLAIGDLTWTPTIDGTVIQEPIADALAAGRYHHVPLITGSTRDEGRLFVSLEFHFGKLRASNVEELRQHIRLLAGASTAALESTYPPLSPIDADTAISDVITDGGFSCAANKVVAEVRGSDQPLYHYEFADTTAPVTPPLSLDLLWQFKAYHGSDVMYLTSSLQGTPIVLDDAQKRLSKQLIGYWTTFAATGNPNGAGRPEWPAVTQTSSPVQRLAPNRTAPFATFTTDHHCALW
ncbi:carboxylesterase/lipase family protein [Amycolatopsis sp. NPDC003865]